MMRGLGTALVLSFALMLAGCSLCWPRGGTIGVCAEDADDDSTGSNLDDDDAGNDDDDATDDDDVVDDDDTEDGDPDDDDDDDTEDPGPAPCILDWSTPLMASEGHDVVCIEPGTFTMGSPTSETDRDVDEEQHEVELTNYIVVSTTEITQGFFEMVTSRVQSECDAGCDPALPSHGFPWLVAVGFCNQLSLQEGLSQAYSVTPAGVTWIQSADGYRLLSESEWEYIARPGSDAGPYSGSATLADVGWCEDTVVHEPGGLADNAFGVFDMSGNVSEWVWDLYAEYPTTPPTVVDPIGPSTGSQRVARGGDYDDLAASCRVADRDGGDPELGAVGRGFRIARTVASGP